MIDEIPEIEKNFRPLDNGFSGVLIIQNDEEFIAWKQKVLLFLENNKDFPLAENIRLCFKSMNEFNDKKKFTEITSTLKNVFNDMDEQEEIGPLKIKKGVKLSSAFEKYTLLEQIGEGGNAKVWKVKNDDGEILAIKLLSKPDQKTLKRFKNETFFCMGASHKNIIRVLDYGACGGNHSFYVMPFYEKTLRKRINDGLSSKEALEIFVGIIEGLKYAHDKGIIHRDIKPENILFEKDSNCPVIADFGIAHFSEDYIKTAVETKHSDRMANFQYAAPEQRERGKEVVPQSDIYAAALILNEMFTQQIPQAPGHRLIADVDKNYGYLDELVDLMRNQEPEKRPKAGTVLTQIKVLHDSAAMSEEIRTVEDAINHAVLPDSFEAKIEGASMNKDGLVFQFNRQLPKQWFYFLQSGNYNHSSIVGYEPQRLAIYNGGRLIMPLQGNESEHRIQSIAMSVKQWVECANALYNDMVKKEAEEEQRRKENELQELSYWNNRLTSVNSVLGNIDFS